MPTSRTVPSGVYVLFKTEFWERFSFYGMKAILILYLTAGSNTTNPGLGWSDSDALALYGWYTSAVTFFAILGGWLADRWFGPTRTVALGCVFLAGGHLILALHGSTPFYAGLCAIVIGVSLLKPNISNLVGNLYRTDDTQGRDHAYTLFYLGINLGAALAPFVVGTAGERFGWHTGFALSGMGMALGLATFVRGQKTLHSQYISAPTPRDRTPSASLLSAEDKHRIAALMFCFLAIVSFFAASEQAGGLIALFAHRNANREIFGWTIPTSWIQSLNPLFIITLGFAVSGAWRLGQKNGFPSDTAMRLTCGLLLTAAGFWLLRDGAELVARSGEKVSLARMAFVFLLHTLGELCMIPVLMNAVHQLAPPHLRSTLLGFFWLSTAVGSKIAGWCGEFASTLGPSEIFLWVTGQCVLTAALVLLARQRLRPWLQPPVQA